MTQHEQDDSSMPSSDPGWT